MNRLILTLLISGLTIVCNAQGNSKSEKIKKLMEISGSGNMGVQMIKNIIPSFQKALPNVPQEFWDDFVKNIKPEDLIDLIVPIYDKYYSEQEVDELVAFYNTPLGKKTISVMPMIMQESMEAGRTWGKLLGEKVAQQLKEKGYDK